MKKLNKAQRDRIDDLRERYATGVQALCDAVTDLNAVIEEAENLRAEVCDSIETYIGERSEKWSESDAASNYSDWQSAWENTVEEVELPEFPETLLSDDDYPQEVSS